MKQISISRLDHLMLVHETRLDDDMKLLAVVGVPDKESETRFKIMHAMVRADHTEDEISAVIRCPDLGIAPKKDKINGAFVAKELQSIRAARDKLIKSYVHDMNKIYFVAREGGRTRVYWKEYDEVLKRSKWLSSSFEDLKKFLSHERVNVAPAGEDPKMRPLGDAWLAGDGRRTYKGMQLRPDQPQEFDGYYNLWTGFNVGDKIGACVLFKQHLLEVICAGNIEHFNYLWNWLARAVQFPQKQGMVAVAMRGERGVGKGVFASTIGEIFGQHFVHLTSRKHLTGNFNAHMRDAILVFADEVVMTGDRDGRAVLQGYITERLIVIEGKGKDVIEVPNMMHIILATNERWIVPAGKKERRYFVLDVSSDRIDDRKYFDALITEIKGGGKAAILAELQAVDLSKFDVRKYPHTEALVEQQIASMSMLEQFFFNLLRDGTLPGEDDWSECIRARLYQYYVTFCQVRHEKPEASETVGRMLRKWGVRRGRHTMLDEHGKQKGSYRFKRLEYCQQDFADDLGWPDFDWIDLPEEICTKEYATPKKRKEPEF